VPYRIVPRLVYVPSTATTVHIPVVVDENWQSWMDSGDLDARGTDGGA
jgi:hypothetical protein